MLMPPPTHLRKYFFGLGACFLVLGLVVGGAGGALEIPWLRSTGIVLLVLGLTVFLAYLCTPFLLVALFFVAWLDWIGLLPLTRIFNTISRAIDGAGGNSYRRPEKYAGEAGDVVDQYRIFATRAARVVKPEDLRESITQLVRGLRRLGGRAFTLYGLAANMRPTKARPFGFSRIGDFLARSTITWNFGRQPDDPTHRLILFTRFDGRVAIYLHLAFVLEGEEATCPGLFAELRFTLAAIGEEPRARTKALERVFALLSNTLRPDAGHLELPGQPENLEWPRVQGTGWLTYTTSAPAAPATTKPCGAGVLVFASDTPVPDRYDEPGTSIDLSDAS